MNHSIIFRTIDLHVQIATTLHVFRAMQNILRNLELKLPLKNVLYVTPLLFETFIHPTSATDTSGQHYNAYWIPSPYRL